jgi:hypothetical protein
MPRKLQVLAIHDGTIQPNDILGNYGDFIDQWHYGIDEDNEITRISEYVQVLSLLQNRLNQSIEIPDIVLVDCLFHRDETKFPIHNEDEDDEDKEIDTRGILYGCILILSFISANPYKPMGYEVYSQGVDKAKNNGYAKTFLLLLQAIFGEIAGDPLRFDSDLLEDSVTSFIKSLTDKTEPKHGLIPAIKRYRANLLNLVKNSQISIDIPFLKKCLNAVKKANNLESVENINDLSVKFSTSRGGGDEIYLSSLFFDCFHENKDKNIVINELSKLIQQHDNSTDLIYKVATERYEAFLCEIDTKDHSGHKIFWQKSSQTQSDKEKVLCLLIAWAIDRYTKHNTKHDLMSPSVFMGIVGGAKCNHNMDRPLGRLIHGHCNAEPTYSPTKFLNLLDTSERWPFPQIDDLKELLIKHLLDGYTDKQSWSSCLKNS